MCNFLNSFIYPYKIYNLQFMKFQILNKKNGHDFVSHHILETRPILLLFLANYIWLFHINFFFSRPLEIS